MELWQWRREVELNTYYSKDSWLFIANPMDWGAWWAIVNGRPELGTAEATLSHSGITEWGGQWMENDQKETSRGLLPHWQAD